MTFRNPVPLTQHARRTADLVGEAALE